VLYPTEEDAHGTLVFLSPYLHQKVECLEVYRCPSSNGWHVGHTSSRLRVKIADATWPPPNVRTLQFNSNTTKEKE
jgi:hypothetical protein